MYIVTATPQDEIDRIVSVLKVKHYFDKVVGSPINKNTALKNLLLEYELEPKRSLMIGDSLTDYEAARENGLTFVLRKTTLNKHLQKKLKCKMIKDFL